MTVYVLARLVNALATGGFVGQTLRAAVADLLIGGAW